MKKANVKILPTILTTSLEDFQSALVMINDFANEVQIDIADGEFTSNRTIDIDNIFWPDNWQVDLHMMVQTPSNYIDRLVLMRPRLVIFHAEVHEDLKPSFDRLKQAGIKTGLALLKETVPETKSDLIARVDHVLIFAGELGKMGGQASILQVEKVRLIKAINPNAEIGWDGGANIDNLLTIVQSGINVINVGSAITNAQNPAEAYKVMSDLAQKED